MRQLLPLIQDQTPLLPLSVLIPIYLPQLIVLTQRGLMKLPPPEQIE